jgi:hypothetical protein
MKTKTINGKKYQLVPLNKVAKPKSTPSEQFAKVEKFLNAKGFKLVSKEETSYTRKDGVQSPAVKGKFSNNGEYIATSTRFWRTK